jgi:hypothetical protein
MFLAEAFKTNNTIQSLDLSGNILGDSPCRVLTCTEILSESKSLGTTMDLAHNAITEEGFKVLLLGLHNRKNHSFKKLILRGNKIGASGLLYGHCFRSSVNSVPESNRRQRNARVFANPKVSFALSQRKSVL